MWNLLVYFHSCEQAQAVIGIAKPLRKSKNASVHARVFLNPNLTKAEAKAQFEIRQKRRYLNSVRRDNTVGKRLEPAASDIQAISEMLHPTSDALKVATAEGVRLHYIGQL
jgi:hypothetical protein